MSQLNSNAEISSQNSPTETPAYTLDELNAELSAQINDKNSTYPDIIQIRRESEAQRYIDRNTRHNPPRIPRSYVQPFTLDNSQLDKFLAQPYLSPYAASQLIKHLILQNRSLELRLSALESAKPLDNSSPKSTSASKTRQKSDNSANSST